MREILFRGKRIDNGEWVYGNLVRGCDEKYAYIVEFGNKELCRNYINVKPDTVGQYTGMDDKCGNKIFEGDILNTTNSNCAIWYVDYKNTAFCCNQGNVNYSCVLDEFVQFSVVEVIGNIHDNPEILKGGDTE